MKKGILFLLCLSMIFSLSGCLKPQNHETETEAETNEETIEETTEETEEETTVDPNDISINLDPVDSTLEPFEDCLAGSDVPDPESFYGMTAQACNGDWKTAGEIAYGFFDVKNYDLVDENGNPLDGPDVNAEEMIKDLNDYLIGRGYGRTKATTEYRTGGTRYGYYKDNIEVWILQRAEDNFGITIIRNDTQETETDAES